MKTSMLRAVSLLALASCALAAHATLLDFEELTGSSNGSINTYGSPLTTQGYVLSALNSGFFSFKPSNNGVDNYTGSIALYSGPTTLTRSGGGLFDVQSIDLANFYQQGIVSGGSTAVFVGVRPDGTTIAQSFALQGVDALQTFAFAGFTGLTALRFGVPSRPTYQFDNVVLTPSVTSPVPGPLAALPFALMVFKRRKRA